MALFTTWPFAEVMEGGKNKALKETTKKKKKKLKEIKIKIKIKEPTKQAHRSAGQSSFRPSPREGGALDWNKTGYCSQGSKQQGHWLRRAGAHPQVSASDVLCSDGGHVPSG